MTQPSDLSLRVSLKSEHRQAFYEDHKDIALVMILVVFLLPLFGVYVTGLLGAALGTVASIGAYYLTPYITYRLGT